MRKALFCLEKHSCITQYFTHKQTQLINNGKFSYG